VLKQGMDEFSLVVEWLSPLGRLVHIHERELVAKLRFVREVADRGIRPDLREHTMTEAPVSPLRRRMIEDMTMRKFAISGMPVGYPLALGEKLSLTPER
jgi:hypothetical protein